MKRRHTWVLLVLCFVIIGVIGIGHGVEGGGTKLYVVGPGALRQDPNAEYWWVPFDVLSFADTAPITITGVELSGHECTEALVSPAAAAVIVVKGVPGPELQEWLGLWNKAHVSSLSVTEAARFASLQTAVGKALAGEPCSYVRLRLANMPVPIEDGRDYHLRVTLSGNGTETSVEATLLARTLPWYQGSPWSPADVHIHSTYSDGLLTPQEVKLNFESMGYKIFYFTDHVGGIPGLDWTGYSNTLSGLCDSYSVLFPGLEVTARSFAGETSDCIALGIGGKDDLMDSYWTPQTAINRINSYCPTPGYGGDFRMAAVAHPTGIINWDDWQVTAYHGFEIMSGYQANFDNNASHMQRWRLELYRLIDQATAANGRFPAALASSDYHRFTHPNWVCWIGTSGWNDRKSVDEALRKGLTVASKEGGLAYFILTYGGATREIGDTLSGVPVQGQLRHRITVKPVRTATYTITIYRGNPGSPAAQSVFYRSMAMTAGQTYDLGLLYMGEAFPGGKHAYYLQVTDGVEYIYTSPIFVTQ